MSNKERANKRARVIEMLGGRCENCGTTDVRVLQIDHRYNDGYKLKRGGRIRGFDASHFGKIISGEDPIERYALLCANCHQLKNKGYIWSSETTSSGEFNDPGSQKETLGTGSLNMTVQTHDLPGSRHLQDGSDTLLGSNTTLRPDHTAQRTSKSNSLQKWSSGGCKLETLPPPTEKNRSYE